jgi:outer membrane protein OmpA-like peptidoglycan-associated protein
MTRATTLLIPAALLVLVGCAAEIPHELNDARTAYNRSLQTTTAQVATPELYDARRLLDLAYQAAAAGDDFDKVRDLAYLALRKVQLAESKARTDADWREIMAARKAIDAMNVEALRRAQAQAQQANQQLAAARARIEQEMKERDEAIAAEQHKVAALTAKMNELAKKEQVTQSDRGTVITLSGSVLFASGKASLLQTAQLRLDQVAEALKSTPNDQQITVEGHTDNVGTADFNQQLSLSRAQAVKDYLVGRGVPSSRIQAYGFGESRPLVDNTTSENRANNRRVEIVVHSGPVS